MTQDTLLYVDVTEIEPDPDQPRRNFDPEGEHKWLVDSVKAHGIINPLTLRRKNGGYVVTAGERRLKAAQEAGLTEVPAVLRDREDDNARVIAIVENVVRQDLDPIEEGDAYRVLADAGRTTEQVAELVNRPLERVIDRMGLAVLPEAARQAVVDGEPLGALRQLASVAMIDPRFAAALAFGASQGVYQWADLTRVPYCLGRLQDNEWGTVTKKCSGCNGVGYVREDGGKFKNDDEYEATEEAGLSCETCHGRGAVRVKSKTAPQPPAYFAVRLGRWSGGEIPDDQIAQLTDDAQKRIGEARARAAEHYEQAKAKSNYYVSQAPLPKLAGDNVELAAKGTQGIGIRVDDELIVTSPEFVSEWLPDAYDEAVKEYIEPPKRSTSGARPKKGKAEMTDAEQKAAEKEAAERAEQRSKETEERAAARQFNHDLSVALAQIGATSVTTDVMKLLVGTIIGYTKETSYNGVEGKGIALWHRYLRDWPTRKNGDPIIPKKADERAEFVTAVFDEFDRALKRAKTPEQALAVLVRYLGAGLADLRGMTNADLDGSSPAQQMRDGRYRAWIKKLLPAGIKKRVQEENGRPGSSYTWKG